ncbi:thiol:disulfide interchange protein DsbA/DsbL [Ferrimonas pelagia]|uniref:Thiol:disulfide interchange protein n=1 Tax=Ferrimonas pelagia TaxID=1177826 RepID=A0ABP9EXF5_9GAMM
MVKSLVIALFCTVAAAGAVASEFIEGQHYHQYHDEMVAVAPSVTEFFSFTCGHCYRFEQVLPELRQGLGEQVGFRQVHVDFGRAFDPELSRTLLIADVLSIKEEIKQAVFEGIHETGSVSGIDDLHQLFLDRGISAGELAQLTQEHKVDETISQWKAYQEQTGLNWVPALVVNDKYLVDHTSVTDQQELMSLLNYLLNKDVL